MSVHLYRALTQPATRFVVDLDGPHWITYPDRKRLPTDCCRRWRWAKYVVVQAYYDSIRRWCAPGHGCKQ